jgi:zinc protease
MLTTRSPFRCGRCWLFALPVVLALGAMPSVATAANTKVAAKFVVPKVEVVSWQLPNGLKVLFLPNHKAPIATVQVFYHVGSKDEHVGIRGVAHMFEHMMFKGTEHVPPEEHARLLKEVGGQVNAFTTEDLTAYHDTVPPSYLGFAMQLEAERMRSLKLFPAIIDSERRVVEEEKRLRIDNNPIGKAIERFRAMAYTKHPYNWTAIGTIEDLDKVTPEDCQKFYDTYYQPNNATLIVVGDVQEAEVRSLADKYFGPIPRGAEPPRNYVEEPPQTAMRSENMALEVQVPVVVGGYHIPRAADPDTAPLEVLAAVLSGGESSRMHQRLVRKDHLAIAAGGVTESMEYPGLFIVFAAHLPDRDQSKVKEALLDEVRRVRTEPVSAHELEQAKNQLAAGYIFGLQTVDGIAQQLGQYQYVYGDWREFLKGASRYLAVSADDVKRVAAKYLVDTNLTLVTLQPAGPGAAPAKGGAK